MKLNGYIESQGFTLVELVVVIVILGILAAMALPKFINVGTEARIASVTHLAGALKTTANLIYAKCMVSAECDEKNKSVYVTMDGVHYKLNYGVPDSGDSLDNGQIDSHINHTGFEAELVSNKVTRFSLSSAPTPENCSVSYWDAFYAVDGKIDIVTEVSGC